MICRGMKFDISLKVFERSKNIQTTQSISSNSEIVYKHLQIRNTLDTWT